MGPVHDVLISHSSRDEQPVRGLARRLREWGFDVAVDFDDPALKKPSDRELAARLKDRFAGCRLVLFAFSATSANSKWLPWQLGLAHGAAGKVALWPLDDGSKWASRTREYLSLYDIVDAEHAKEFLEKLIGETRSAAPAPVEVAEEPASATPTTGTIVSSNEPDPFTEFVLKGPAQFYAAWVNAVMGKR